MGQDLDAGFHLDEARLGQWQMRAAGEEEAGQGLPMSAAEATPRDERRRFRLHSLHCLILNGYDLKWSSGAGCSQKGVRTMPIFEYICKECDHQFEALVYGKQKAECPKCHGGKLAPQLSVFAVSAKGDATSAPSTGACGSCGDPRGPGSCSRPNMN
jgi:putative FmdB family regulatory protein